VQLLWTIRLERQVVERIEFDLLFRWFVGLSIEEKLFNTGTAKREAAVAFSERLPEGATLGADKNYDAEAFVEGLKARRIESHVVINGTVSKNGKVRKTAVPSEVAASIGYAISQRLLKAHRGTLRLEQDGGRARTSEGAASTRSAALSSSPWPPATSCACPGSCLLQAKCVRRHENSRKNDPKPAPIPQDQPVQDQKMRPSSLCCEYAVTFSAAC
jgi:hypothetical protein